MAKITTGTCPPAFLTAVLTAVPKSLSPSEDDLTLGSTHKLFQQIWKPDTKRREADSAADYILLG